MTGNRDQAVAGGAWPAPLAGPSPAGRGAPGTGLRPRATRRHATQARDFTPSLPVVLQGRGARGTSGVAKVNAETDPFRALARSAEYLTSVLRPASRRNWAHAAGWCWAAVHVIDALAAAVERGDAPHPWFRDHGNWRLNPDGWAPLVPVTATFRTLTRRPGRGRIR